ncbi:hypothetical protein D7D52_17685 [Nocardia yunnanensis]|uniref:ABC transporter permease n=1 Tax=Nocardia yunnanensis TaxID=2382165 RepID=A0A386ZD24_9NOCA|nr:hypothetical protein [Nocardia yunnanensis]AYF75388.1 hypothetical protein D7D52_17685 [Nocardia yunnanensis]
MNRTVLRVEWYRWLRTRRAIALVAAFALFGFVSLLGAKYLPDLIGHSDEIQLLRIPDWRDGLQQYVKNTGFLIAAVAMILAAQASAVRATDPVGIYYLSRETSPVRVYLPRILMAATVIAIAAALGAAVALYECWALFGSYPLPAAVGPLALQAIAVVLVALFAAALAARLSSAAIAAAITAAIYVCCLLLSTVPTIAPYLPTTALQPTVTPAFPVAHAAKSLLPLAISTATSLALVLTTPIRTIKSSA